MSGGRSTVALAKGRRLAAQAGDISAIAVEGEVLTKWFLAECKAYRNLNITGLLKDNGNLLTFWKELQAAAEVYHKHPMLVAKQNRLPPIVCISPGGLAILGLKYSLLSSTVYDLCIVRFDDFLKRANPPKQR